MRTFLSTTFILLALVVGAAGAAPAAHAQDIPIPDDAGTVPNLSGTALDPDGSITAANIAADKAAAKIATDSTEKKNEGFDFIMIKIMSLFAWLVGVAAMTLNYAVYYTVVTMGDYVHRLSAIGVTWRILRDIANIMFIFGFIGAGIATILNIDQYGWKTKMLPMLVVGAVFLNFSLFITEAMIDGTNLFATQFYTQIVGGTLPTAADMSAMTPSSEGISNKIMNQLGLQTIYGEVQNTTKASQILAAGNSWLIGFMGILLFIITAFVMFSLAFILIARFVALIFFMILSPVGFMGLAIPQMQYRAGQWWSNFLEQIITAPVLLLLLYIALAVINDAQFLTGLCVPGASTITGAVNTNSACTSNWLGYVEGNFAGFASMLLSFLVAMGLLLVVVIKAKSMSAFGAKGAIQLGGKLSFGAVSLGGRATFGMAGNLLANKRMQSVARRGGAVGLGLKGVVLAGKGLRSATYDVRNVPGGAGLGALGIDAGKGATITAKQAHDAQYGVKPIKEWFGHSKEEREQAGREMDFKDAQENLAAGTITQAQHDAIVLPVLSKMSTKQLEELGGIKKGVDALVNNLSPQQFEALMKSDKLSDTEKNKIKDARYRVLSSAVGSGVAANVKKSVNSLSKGELESMPTTMLTNPMVLDQLTDKQRETITDSKERTAAEKDLVRKSSPGGSVEDIFNTAGGGVTGAVAVAGSPNFARLTVPQLAKLDKAILTQPTVAEKLTTATLIELQEQKKLTPVEMITIGNHIRASTTANAKTKDYVTTGPGAALWA